ncbi:poly-gamma-glutamate biosynthesis protein PgsC [bacterium]|nr:poly-gamma-glutamate biosynthesis protein PgsC [bacterium]MBU1983743.1 poly-gamma-glutamate biosynthesis protein PgsC [bacterium]
MIELTIGLGVLISLVFHEVLGAAAGGIVVPGYIALHLHEPMRLLATLIVSFITFLAIRVASRYMFIYGRRRLVMAILLGFIFGYISREIIAYEQLSADIRLEAIGFIIPGLIANWFERQGVMKTIATMMIAAPLVRILVILFTGGEIFHAL